MNCHSCGFQNDDDSRICNGCGSPLRKICPRCGFENLAESKFCGGCGNRCQEAQAGDTSGERRQITALFVDLVGPTELSQRLDPEDLRDLLAVYHTVCSDAVEHHAGHIAQYLGDGVVVYFGYPRSHEDDAQRAIRCGLDILESIQILNRDSNDMDNIALHVRLGIHSGRVVIEHVGVGDVGDRIALGGTTNIAARLEGEAPVDGLAVSHTTWQMVRGIFYRRRWRSKAIEGLDRAIAHMVRRWTGWVRRARGSIV